MQNEKIKIEGNNFCISGENAVEFSTNKRYSKDAVIQSFLDCCAENKIKKAFCEIDKNAEGQQKEGITVYGIQPKGKNLMTVYFHENEYGNLKDEIQALNFGIKRAQDKMNRLKEIKGRLCIIAGSTILATTLLTAALKKDNPGKTLKQSNEISTESNNYDPSSVDYILTDYEQEKQEQREEQRQQEKNQEQQEVQKYEELMEQVRDFSTMENVIPIEQYYEEQGIENPAKSMK